MFAAEALHDVPLLGWFRTLLDLPPLRQWRKWLYRRRFLDNPGDSLFMGRYPSFEAAAADLPSSLPEPIGGEIVLGLERSTQVRPDDYPLLFWLGRSFDIGLRTVFELGGHVGIKYYAFRRVLPLPDGLRWTVWDLPPVVERGTELATLRAPEGMLRFTTDLEEASGNDILLASGSLPYFPERLTEILAAMPVKPRRILLNAIAVHPSETFYTVNSLTMAFRAFRIQAWEELQDELEAAGYMRRDVWRNEGQPIQVPFERDGDQVYYVGGCYDLR